MKHWIIPIASHEPTHRYKIKAFNPGISVVMRSSRDKIEVAINCMHHKAFDYVAKSETAFIRLQKIIDAIFEYKKKEIALVYAADVGS